MFNRLKSHFYNFDWIIMAAVLLLVSFGLVEIYSVALGRESLDLLNFHKQIFFVVFWFRFIDYFFFYRLLFFKKY